VGNIGEVFRYCDSQIPLVFFGAVKGQAE